MRKTNTGFSLIEIMVVIVIIGLLASVSTVSVIQFLDKGRVTTATSQMTEIVKALDLYRMQSGSYPSTSKGLKVLTESKSGQPLMKEIPKDPWGNEYKYRSTGGSKYTLTCYGSDGREGGTGIEEDIVMKSDAKSE
ncbi:MAG: type II secretion system major pseudopilin GspG [Planctomycetes bacterium]|jgi:general secretion pathway protein G|nr:type II secretion system major pseudopilin GspG [Planctomycetota bacterium]HON44155.1 type II secretion system major pseudopilin GspG [Planctomycetota bacterium]HPY75345.1 type II secretion system major pseudopilin GspG [Planctomycetota bacterium]HQA99698.1 type II secretion system major pseudopilin GspG [Planctomycetota bacterium]HRU51320.1 type II secretion system major pseudopilin GspG [Planctomycetota bacterium]